MTGLPTTNTSGESYTGAKWTPNEALASLRECKEEDCLWVWDSKELANTRMSYLRAFYYAKEKARDL